MEESMKKKLAQILDRVKESQSGLTLSQLDIVAGIKHEPVTNRLIVVTDPSITSKVCCMVFDIYGVGEIEDLIASELKKEFPGFSVEFAGKSS